MGDKEKKLSQQDTDFTDLHHSESKVSNINEPPLNYDSKRDFTSLEAWEKARAVKLFFYGKILPKLPIEEKYNLGSQIRNSGVSATANIAEGYGRFHYKEGIQFYRISRASIYELKDHLISCLDFDYINKELFNEGIRQS